MTFDEWWRENEDRVRYSGSNYARFRRVAEAAWNAGTESWRSVAGETIHSKACEDICGWHKQLDTPSPTRSIE